MSSLARRLDPWPTLRGAPIALPQLLAILALVTLSAAEGGFPLEHWAPASVLISLLLMVSLVALPVGDRRPALSTPANLAIVGFAVWTAASLLWSDDVGAAAVAATRTALLAVTFVLFSRWRHAPRAASVVVTVLTAGLGVFAWGVLFELRTAEGLDGWFFYDRLLEPIGYVNAGAAFWGVAAFLAVGLLGGQLPPAQRIVGALVVVPAAALSLLCLSRGGILASAIVVVLLLAALPGRARNGAAFGIGALGLAVALPSLLDVGEAVRYSTEPAAVLHTAVVRVFLGAVLAVLATVVWIRIERSVAPTDPARTSAARAGAGLLAVLATVAVLAAVAGVGPVTTGDIRRGVDTITQGYEEQVTTGDSRLSAGLNSGRWDFWTVAWDQFERAPLIGAGADNYRQDYLQFGETPENPRYPHSIWLRSLGQLGLVGTAFLLAWVLLVVAAVRRLASAPDPAGRALALAGGGAFGIWIVQGSADWLLEFGGLSAIVAAIAGLVVAAGPDRAWRKGALAAGSLARADGDYVPTLAAAERGQATNRFKLPASIPLQRLGLPASVALLAVVALWSGAQWVADRDRTAAASLAADQPVRAVDRAERARSLEPFGEQADTLLGALAIRRGDLPAATAAYLRAYENNPRATRPRLWLGVLASASGDRREARRWLRRASRTAPRDAIVLGLLDQIAAGQQLSPEIVQNMLSDRTAALVRDPDPVAPSPPPTPEISPPAAAG